MDVQKINKDNTHSRTHTLTHKYIRALKSK